MANTWASIGRAQPHKYAGEILQNKMAIEQNERQALLAQSKLAMDAEQIERMRRQNALDAEAQQKAQTLHPVEEFHGYFRKGAESSNYKMVMDWAKQRGLINMDAGGLGAIREGDIPQVMEFMKNPMTLKNITRNVISDIDADIAGINSQLGEGDKKKDPNPKQQEALAQLNQERLSALSVNANLVNHLKQQEQAEIAAKAAIEKERRDIAAAEIEHTRKLEQIEANKTGKPETGFITLQDPNNPKNTKTLRKSNPRVDGYLDNGWTEVKTPAVSVNINEGKPLSIEGTKDLSNFRDILTSVNELTEMWEPGLTGPIQGRARNWASIVRNDPKFVSFKKKLAQLRTIVYSFSGKQINAQELEWLKKEVLPALEEPDQNFEATLKVFDDWVKSKESGYTADLESIGYKVPPSRQTKTTKQSNPLDSFWKK